MTVIATGVTGTSYADKTGLTASTQYTYQVDGVNAVGPGPQSAPVSATTSTGASTPGKVIGLTYAATLTSITVNWPVPAGPPPTSYTVNFNGVITSGIPTTSFTQSGLTASTQYAIIVTAVNGSGSGPPSSTLLASTSAVTSSSTLLQYIQGLQSSAGRYVLLGQHGDLYTSSPTQS